MSRVRHLENNNGIIAIAVSTHSVAVFLIESTRRNLREGVVLVRHDLSRLSPIGKDRSFEEGKRLPLHRGEYTKNSNVLAKKRD